MLTESRSGRGRVAVVTGPVACGKTELLHSFAEQAADVGAASLGAVASRSEQAVPFGVVRQILRCADLPPRTADQVSRLLNHGSVTSFLTDLGPGGADQVPAVVHALCLSLLDLAERSTRPLVIGVDDLQFCDAASLSCLSSFVRRFRSAPVMLVLTRSGESGPAQQQFEAELPGEPYSRRVWLEALSNRGVQTLLAQHLGSTITRTRVGDFHRLSGGNPLLLRGLVEDYQRAAVAGVAEPTPGPAFGHALLSCLFRCDPATVPLARGLAVLGESATPALVGELVQRDVESVVRTVSALNTAGILAADRFRHPMARAAVLDAMPPDERAELHARAAVLLHKEGVPAPTVARHLLAAQGASPCALPILHEAAEAALTDGEVDLALGYLRLARGLDDDADEQQRATTTAMLVRSEWHADPSMAARHVPALSAAAQAGHLTGRHAPAMVNSMLWFGQVDPALEILTRVDSRPEAAGPEVAAQLRGARMWLSSLYPAVGGQLPAEAPGPARPPTTAAHPPQLDAVLLVRQVLTGGPTAEALTTARAILRTARLDGGSLGLVSAALLTLAAADRLAEADRFCTPLLTQARSRSVPTWLAVIATLGADIALRRGDLAAAQDRARTALAALPARSWGVGMGLPVSVLLQSCVARGRHEESVSHLRIPQPDAMFQTPVGLYYLLARGRYHQATGSAHAALHDFRSIGETMERWRLEAPALIPWRTDAAQACLSLGRRREARDLAAEQLGLLRPHDVRLRAVCLRVLTVGHEPSRRVDLLGQAVEALEDCDDRLELARALTDLGDAYHDLGRTGRAQELRDRAQRIVAECGAVCPVRTPVGTAAVPTGAPQGRTAAAEAQRYGLSEAEHRVAVLAARGYSNRQIAEKLFVTVSTVEQHLTRVYRKLRVTRRTELAVGLHDELARPG